jgi:hypothetical protein
VGVRQRAADKHRMEHSGKRNVGDELALSREQPLILAS